MSLYDKASLMMTPSGVKANKLYSEKPHNGDGDFTFARTSTGTRVNKDGYIETVATGEPRLDYPFIDGVVQDCPSLLLEPVRTNSFSDGENVAQTLGVGNATIIQNNNISPKGNLSAAKFTENTSTSAHFARIGTVTATQSTISVFVKSDGRNRVFLTHDLVNGVIFNVNLGVIDSYSGSGYTASIEDYGNGWYRCVVTATFSNTGTFYLVTLLDGSNSISYLGDGVSSVLLYGAQLEEASYATSYIPTSGSSVTRSAETCNGAGNASTFNDSEGVLMAEISALADDLSERRFGISDGTSSNVVRVGYTSISNRIIAVIYNGSNQAVLTYPSPDITQNSKIAVKYKENDFALWVNGIKRSTDISGSVFTTNTLNSLQFNIGGGSHFYSSTKQIQYFDSALSDTELESLTSWTSFTEMAQGQLYTIR